MEIVEAKYEIIGECPTNAEAALKWIELAGRTAYQSQDKITKDSAIKFCQMIAKRGHFSVLEHSNLVLKKAGVINIHDLIDDLPFPIGYYIPFHMVEAANGFTYIGGNFRAWLEIAELPREISNQVFGFLHYLVSKEISPSQESEFQIVTDPTEIPLGMKRIMVRFIIPRGVSHELVRHRRRIGITQECVAGDTVVHKEAGKEITIQQLYNQNHTIDLKSADSSGNIIKNKMLDVFLKGVHPVYEVETKQGYKIQTTLNHKFQNQSGKFVKLESLKVGDFVNVNGRPALQLDISNEELSKLYLIKKLNPLEIAKQIDGSTGYSKTYRKVNQRLKNLLIFEPRKNDKKPEKYTKNHTISSYKKMSSSIQKGYKNGRVVWNKNIREGEHLGVDKQAQSLRKNHHNNSLGEFNSNWKGDQISDQAGRKRGRKAKEMIKLCELCNQRPALEVHHKDKNPHNNNPDNICKVCINCHRKCHFGWHVGTITHADEITKITYMGKKKTYDISMESPNNNYIANGFVVHNSTRFVRYDNIQVIQPPGLNNSQELVWRGQMQHSEKTYQNLITSGCSAQIARSVLPIALKAEVVTTADIAEWKHIFDLRASAAAQPEMREIMIPLHKEFLNHGWL